MHHTMRYVSLFIFALVFVAGCGPSPVDTDDAATETVMADGGVSDGVGAGQAEATPNIIQRPALVEAVTYDPTTHSVTVTGFLADGCSSLGPITQTTDGDKVTIEILQERESDAICTQALVDFETSVPIEASADSVGTITVNDNQVAVTAATEPEATDTPAPTAEPAATTEPADDDTSPAATATITATTTVTPAVTYDEDGIGTVETDVTRVEILQGVNLRSGPAITFRIVGGFLPGETADVIGVSEDGAWWRVACPSAALESCWLTGNDTVTRPIPVEDAAEDAAAPSDAAEESAADDAATATPTPEAPADGDAALPDGWRAYESPLGLTLAFPQAWEQVDGYDERFAGEDGFIQLSVLADSGTVAEVAAAEAAAEAVAEAAPYGTEPTIDVVAIGDGEGRIIRPSADQTDAMNNRAAIVVAFPEPLTVGSSTYDFLLIWVDAAHVDDVAASMRFAADAES